MPLQQLPLERDQEDISAFVEHQRQVFDELAEWFASDEAIPADLVPVYEYLTNQILESIIDALPERSPEDADSSNSDTRHSTIRLLDVGCGTGALFPFYDQAIRTYNQERHPGTEWKFHITGLDLSPNMIAKANEKVTSIHSISTASHFDLVVGDIGQFSISSEDDRDHPRYDAVVFNAVFGNFWKPRNVLEHVAIQVLRPHGRVFVTHPLGPDCVRQLHESSAETVPHLLPTKAQWQSDVALMSGVPLVLHQWYTAMPVEEEEEQEEGATLPLYYACLRRVRYRTLPNLIRLRGTVDTGFGRGGKQLGFPTANLGPAHILAEACQSIEAGVYLGWAVVEYSDPHNSASSAIHKAVVNVGFSPTFQDQNPMKMVEAHLILDAEYKDKMQDFYHQTMRLQLVGFLRPEAKFPNFPALVAQITADRDDADEALDLPLYNAFRRDPFLQPHEVGTGWTGSDGGDATASWEFAPLAIALENMLKME